MKYFWNILISIDQFFNTLFGGNPDETISSRSAKANRKGVKWGCILCWFLDKIDKNHCENSIELDEGDKID